MSEDITATLNTNHGSITFRLMPDVAPKTVENFTGLIEKGYYDGVVFHRIIRDFMLQGGDPTGTGRGGESLWGNTFEDECDSKVTFDKPGLLAMANAGPGTNGSQFFITTAKTPWLHMKHTIFGEVTEGMDVVQRIEAVDTDPRDKPKKPVRIESASVERPA
ncbi:MAG: peptidylprolyl isomerase [Opitutales bacterium]